MLTPLDTLIIFSGIAVCWLSAAVVLDRVIALVARHVR